MDKMFSMAEGNAPKILRNFGCMALAYYCIIKIGGRFSGAEFWLPDMGKKL